MFPIRTERHVLANGLTVVLAPDRAVPVVAINLWYGVGSRNEREGRTGFAHLFEHMMFQGSAHVPKGRHFELVEAAGGSLNASTWFDRTNYFETLPSHHLDLALWLESDRMGWLLPAMTEEKLENQRDVVRNERRQRYDNQPYGDWDERIQELVYPEDHPYRHTVIGSMEDIGAASLQDVREFFETFYLPGNAVLTLAGDIDPIDALARVERYFGEIPGSDADPPPIPGRHDPGPVIGGTTRDTVRSRVPLPRIYMAFRIPPVTDPAFYTADVATSVLSDGRASRLYRRLVREQELAKDVAAFAFPLATGRSLMIAWLNGYPESDPDELEAGLVRELEGLQDVSRDEVARAVALSETRLLRQAEQLASRADLLSMHQQLFGDAERLNGEVERLRAVTPEAVREFAATTLGSDNRAVLTYLPGEEQG
ncbi:MAG: pitrilysin family protein [Gemmatimonadota bacterium]